MKLEDTPEMSHNSTGQRRWQCSKWTHATWTAVLQTKTRLSLCKHPTHQLSSTHTNGKGTLRAENFHQQTEGWILGAALAEDFLIKSFSLKLKLVMGKVSQTLVLDLLLQPGEGTPAHAGMMVMALTCGTAGAWASQPEARLKTNQKSHNFVLARNSAPSLPQKPCWTEKTLQPNPGRCVHFLVYFCDK